MNTINQLTDPGIPPSAIGDCDCGGDCACAVDVNPQAIQSMPIIYSLELTPLCNNRCAGCSNVFVENKSERIIELPKTSLALAQWREVLDKITPYAVRLKITGGEPTFHPDFEQIIQEIEQRKIPFTLFTNARWRHPQRTIDFLKKISTCSGLLISLHGATAEAHDAFTGVKGSFQEAAANIQLATQSGLAVSISCVFTRHNAGQIPDIIKSTKELGANATIFNRYIGLPTQTSLSASDLAQVTRWADELSKTESVRFGTCIPLCFVESSSTGCLAGTAYCTIDPWGNLRPCNHAPWLAGNLLTGTLSEAWNSEAMNRWRGLITDTCVGCSHFSKCRGGCRADAILNGVEQDPLMQVLQVM